MVKRRVVKRRAYTSSPSVIMSAALKSGIINGKVPVEDIVKFGVETDIVADYFIGWSNYFAIIKAPDEEEEEGEEEGELASW